MFLWWWKQKHWIAGSTNGQATSKTYILIFSSCFLLNLHESGKASIFLLGHKIIGKSSQSISIFVYRRTQKDRGLSEQLQKSHCWFWHSRTWNKQIRNSLAMPRPIKVSGDLKLFFPGPFDQSMLANCFLHDHNKTLLLVIILIMFFYPPTLLGHHLLHKVTKPSWGRHPEYTASNEKCCFQCHFQQQHIRKIKNATPKTAPKMPSTPKAAKYAKNWRKGPRTPKTAQVCQKLPNNGQVCQKTSARQDTAKYSKNYQKLQECAKKLPSAPNTIQKRNSYRNC